MPNEKPKKDVTPLAWWSMAQQLVSNIGGLRKIMERSPSRASSVHIEKVFVFYFGGHMPLDLSKLNAALTEDTNVGDILDTVVEAVVAAYSVATSQKDIDAITDKLNSNVEREKLKASALKNLVTPQAGTLTASWNGPTSATAGQSYSGQASAIGGTAPYTFSVASGAVPDGLTFDATGALSGVPSFAGSFGFGVQVTDSMGATGTVSCAITVSS